jgi:thiamine biosynthesis lipoprotein
MATRFEFVLAGDDPARLRAAGEEAVDEIHRWESALSLYRPESDIAQVNAGAFVGPVVVRPSVLRLLLHARRLSALSEGAFDPTVGPLVRAWGFMGGTGSPPGRGLLEAARRQIGWQGVELDELQNTVQFRQSGMMLDLGAIGKGFALDRAADLLREMGIHSALLHGGTSSIVAWGKPPEGDGWRIAFPATKGAAFSLDSIDLVDQSLSVSGVQGKAFQEGGRILGHVLDPRLGNPVEGVKMAAALLPSATDSDALSTALLVLGEGGLPLLRERFPEGQFWVAEGKTSDFAEGATPEGSQRLAGG